MRGKPPRHGKRPMRPSIALGAIALLLPALAQASPVGLLVPSYFSPGTGGPGGSGDGWAAMTAAAASGVSVTAVLNPNSGPAGAADPAYTAALSNLEAAGGRAIAYVATGGGTVPLATVESQIGTYIGQYGVLIDGFFLDEMSVLPGTLGYYQSLNGYIKGLQPSYLTVGNPGHPFLNGVAPADYLAAADVVTIFEGPDAGAPGAAGFNNYPYGLDWFQTSPAQDFANIVYDASGGATMAADIAKAVSLNAGEVYITDQGAGGANPYAALPTYWNAEVADVGAIPEPASASLFGLGVAVAAALKRRRKPILER